MEVTLLYKIFRHLMERDEWVIPLPKLGLPQSFKNCTIKKKKKHRCLVLSVLSVPCVLVILSFLFPVCPDNHDYHDDHDHDDHDNHDVHGIHEDHLGGRGKGVPKIHPIWNSHPSLSLMDPRDASASQNETMIKSNILSF